MRVFLTGGTGLVGSHVAERLRLAGHSVRAAVRSSSDTAHLRRLGCDLVEADITDPGDGLARAMHGCDALIHAAALVGARATRDRYRDANVRGTAAVFDAAVRAGTERAIHVSSVAVYGPVDGVITEDRWREQAIDERAFYAWSKRAAEIEAWKHDDVHGLRVTAVRPALIYGERDRHVSPRLDRLITMPLLPLPDGGRHVLPLVYAGNVAAGITAALERGASAGRAYNLARDNDTALRDVIAMWSSARGRRTPRMPAVPGRLIGAAAGIVDWLSRAVPGIDLPGARRPARLLREDNPYDSSRAASELDWTTLVPPEEAIERTVRWLHGG